ncbi:MAG: hypothetical protein K1060chlam4_01192 [Candidatus Anoxychlamydiales bacterium]|nr:hypothetical protein [Candidatus Anoxychlamydiales bacterium]
MAINANGDFSIKASWFPCRTNHFDKLPIEIIARIFAKTLENYYGEEKREEYIKNLKALDETDRKFHELCNLNWTGVRSESTEPLPSLRLLRNFQEINLYISQINDSYWKTKAQIELVKALLSKNEIEAAKTIISEISNSYWKAKAQIELVKALPLENEIEAAKAIIGEINNSYGKGEAQIKLVKALLSKKEIEAAKTIMGEISFKRKGAAQVELVKALALENEIKAAKAIMGEISSEMWKGEAQVELVKALLINACSQV